MPVCLGGRETEMNGNLYVQKQEELKYFSWNLAYAERKGFNPCEGQ